MAIRAVVFDIGSVLEIIDDSVFPGSWPGRLGLETHEFLVRLDGLPGNPVVGEVTEAEIRSHWPIRSTGFDLIPTPDKCKESFRARHQGRPRPRR